MQTNAPPLPTPDTIASAWKFIEHERSQLVALSIALAARIEDRERHEEHDSTELLREIRDELRGRTAG